MPLSFGIRRDMERGTAKIGIPTSIDDKGEVTISIVNTVHKDELGEVFMFIGAIKYWAKLLAPQNASPVIIYNHEDFEEHGPDLPHGFECGDD